MLLANSKPLLRLPSFAWSVLALYWSAALVGMLYSLRWLQFKGKRNDLLGWALGMQRIFKFKVMKIGQGQLYRGKCIYLINHRSWADMLVDQYVTEGRGMFMSRWAMFFVFPPLMASMLVIKVILMFKRGKIADKEGFNRWIDCKLQESPQPALVVYPEGHRSTSVHSLPLKRGMLHYAYSRKMAVQVIIGLNKEAILAEKQMKACFGQTVGVAYSDVIDPSNFDGFDKFMSEVQKTWDAQWHQVFSSQLEGLPELQPSPPDLEYPEHIRWLQALVIPLNILLLLWLGCKSLSWGVALLGICGPMRLPVIVLTAVWIAISFAQAWQPADIPKVEVNGKHKQQYAKLHEKER